jgi:hypothetical protein
VIENLSEPFFIRGADCWGWATQKRGWEIFESDGQKLLNEVKNVVYKKRQILTIAKVIQKCFVIKLMAKRYNHRKIPRY